MSREVPEWIGAHDDQPLPARVQRRIYDGATGKCCQCGRVTGMKLKPAFDHKIALINGGENRESNFQLLCVPCHKQKTKADVAEKSKVARVRKKHLGLSKPKRTIPGRRFNGDPIPSRVRP